MNIAKYIEEAIAEGDHRQAFLATVTGTDGNRVLLQRSDAATADTQSYARLVSYASPATSDEVLVMKVGGSYIVIGEVIR